MKTYTLAPRNLTPTDTAQSSPSVCDRQRESISETLIDKPDLRAAIDQLLAVKVSTGEAQVGQPVPVLNRFIDQALTRLESVTPPPASTIDSASLDQLLFKTVIRGLGHKTEAWHHPM